MRWTYKYIILASSLALYAWFVGWYVFALLFLSIVLIASVFLKITNLKNHKCYEKSI